jgi:hypothetical protein
MLKIEDFHALLASDKNNNSLLETLREFMTIEKPEEIVAAVLDTKQHWGE